MFEFQEFEEAMKKAFTNEQERNVALTAHLQEELNSAISESHRMQQLVERLAREKHVRDELSFHRAEAVFFISSFFFFF